VSRCLGVPVDSTTSARAFRAPTAWTARDSQQDIRTAEKGLKFVVDFARSGTAREVGEQRRFLSSLTLCDAACPPQIETFSAQTAQRVRI